MGLQIRMLGPFEAMPAAGPQIRLPTRKAEALLAFLARRPGERHRRERLATLLWPDRGSNQARASLRQTLALVRKSFSGVPVAGVCTQADAIYLDPHGVDLDTLALERAVTDGSPAALERVITLYRGDFLENLAITSEPFEDWRSQEQDHLREKAIAALGRLLDICIAGGMTERAIQVGERLLKLDPQSEATYRSLMTAYLAQGARGSAIRQYERCRRHLHARLGAAPSSETETLYRQIVRGSITRVQLPSRSLPSIAVLPFANLSGDATQDYFVRGIVEDIVGALSRFRSLRVIARNSSFAARQAGESARDTGVDLGADYVIEGSVRRAGDGVRISAQLTDIASGVHVWSDRYDAPAQQVLELQDRITRAVAGALAIRIDEELLSKAKRRGHNNLAAYECWLRGRECFNWGTPESSAEAVKFFRYALDIDPGYARAHAGLAIVYFGDWNCHGWHRWDQCETLAFEHARRAVELDDSDHVSHCILSRVHLFRRAFELAEKHLERAMALNPNDADCLARMAATRAQLGDAAAGIALGEAALALNPRYPDWYVGLISLAYLMAARHEEAVALMERAPDVFIDTRAFLAIAYAYLGNRAKARENAAAFRSGYARSIAVGRDADTIEAMRWVLHVTPFRHEPDTRHLRKGLKKAGIGE